jgi:aldose sugar dehydrogenase
MESRAARRRPQGGLRPLHERIIARGEVRPAAGGPDDSRDGSAARARYGRRAQGTVFAALAALLAGCAVAGDAAVDPEVPATRPEVEAREVPHVVNTVAEGLEHPWGMAFLPGDEGILVTERPGRLRIIRNGQLDPQPIDGVPRVLAERQGGLLDVEVHPEFATNRLVYLTYSKPGQGGATTALARGRLEQNRLVGVEDIFVADAWSGTGQHFGSRIAFDGRGHVFITIGDRGQPERAQNPGDHAGTTIRLLDDGRVPPDNPFVGRADARDEIYTYGNRNAQGMAFHPETGELWQNEHGPRGGDELNRIVAGENYGWPRFSFGNHYDGRRIPDPQAGQGTALPVHHWTPAIAPSGLTIYSGEAFPQWRGDLFVGGLAGEDLIRLRLEGDRVVEEERLFEDRDDRIRAVRTGPDGLIYILVDASSAPLLQLVPGNGE